MIKTLIKHTIGEAAIKTLFDTISTNFPKRGKTIMVQANRLMDKHLDMKTIYTTTFRDGEVNLMYELQRNPNFRNDLAFLAASHLVLA